MKVYYYDKYFSGTKEEVEKAYKKWRRETEWNTIVDHDAVVDGDTLKLTVKYSVVW